MVEEPIHRLLAHGLSVAQRGDSRSGLWRLGEPVPGACVPAYFSKPGAHVCCRSVVSLRQDLTSAASGVWMGSGR